MKIDFYILEASVQKSWYFACQLTEKAYLENRSVYIHTASLLDAERIDALLWTFRDISFVPHQVIKDNADCFAPIQIGFDDHARTATPAVVPRLDRGIQGSELQHLDPAGLAQRDDGRGITSGIDNAHTGDVLINLTEKIPTFYQKFDQSIEIVFSNPLVQQLARERYKQYRNDGCDITTYKLKANEL